MGTQRGSNLHGDNVNTFEIKEKDKTAGKGTTSPLIVLETHFLDIILQLAVMHQPLTPSGAIQMINPLVETSHFQREIIEWKAKHLELKEDDTTVKILLI